MLSFSSSIFIQLTSESMSVLQKYSFVFMIHISLPIIILPGTEWYSLLCVLDCVWNVTAHAQKPDFVFQRNGRVHLNQRGRQFSRGVRIGGSNAGYTIFRGSVKVTGYPLHSPVSPSLLLSCVTVCHHISTRLNLPRNSLRHNKIDCQVYCKSRQ